jgi:hypothetical protein
VEEAMRPFPLKRCFFCKKERVPMCEIEMLPFDEDKKSTVCFICYECIVKAREYNERRLRGALPVRRLAPGEVLRSARSDFTYGTGPMSAEARPFDVAAGFKMTCDTDDPEMQDGVKTDYERRKR